MCNLKIFHYWYMPIEEHIRVETRLTMHTNIYLMLVNMHCSKIHVSNQKLYLGIVYILGSYYNPY